MSTSSAEPTLIDTVAAQPSALSTSPSHSIAPPFEEQAVPRLKGRQRLLAGLHRISSSHSVTRLGAPSRRRPYSGNGRGSVSCMSLASASSLNTPSFGSPLTADLSYPFSTAPTSAAVTPGIEIPAFDERARLRYLSKLGAKDTANVPADVQLPASRAGLSTPRILEVDEDYFSLPVARKPERPSRDFNFWRDLPSELRMTILSQLEPRHVVRCSAVSKAWRDMCFDGQLWAILDTTHFYQDIPADALIKIILSAGPFVRDLNLRGCVQLRERWHARGLSDACRNLESLCLEGCRIDRTSIHNFLYQNDRLVHIDLCGLAGATNAAMKIIATHCPRLQFLNVSWCNNVDTRGLKRIVESCHHLTDLRACEIRGWEDLEFAQLLFTRNTLERLLLINCDSFTDEALAVMIEGKDSEVDCLTGRRIVPPRKLRHLDLSRCRGITDKGVRSFVHNLPHIEGLQLSKLRGITDTTMVEMIPTMPMLTHLDLEELEDLTNAVLQCLSTAPCAKRLRHLSISYCENLGDVGMLAVIKSCTGLRKLDLDNTRISDLVLAEAAIMMKQRTPRALVQGKGAFTPDVGLSIVAYDCQNVTWTGVREILHRNAEVFVITEAHELPPLPKNAPKAASSPDPSPLTSETASSASSTHTPSRPPTPTPPRIHIVRTTSYPSSVIQLKCFYTYQPTVDEHTKRVLRGEFASAKRLEKKWAEFMVAQEEAGAVGAGARRRRRRAREAHMMHADEEDAAVGGSAGVGVGGGRRRRARSGGCTIM